MTTTPSQPTSPPPASLPVTPSLPAGTSLPAAGEAAAHARAGRPRDDGREAAILDAAVSLVAEVGYDRMSMDAIAARAKASKATIYRRWPGKAELVVDAISRRNPDPGRVPDHGSLRADLLDVVGAMCAGCEGSDGELICGIAAASRSDPALGACMRSTILEHKRRVIEAIVERAVGRGELAAGASAATVLEVVTAVLLLRIVEGDAPEPGLALHLVDDLAIPALLRPALPYPAGGNPAGADPGVTDLTLAYTPEETTP